MMSKGQRNHARQPVARVRGQESGQSRNPSSDRPAFGGKPLQPKAPASFNPRSTPAAAPSGKPLPKTVLKTRRDGSTYPADARNVAPAAQSRRDGSTQNPDSRRGNAGRGEAAFKHERQFGNKNFAVPGGAPSPDGRGSNEFGKARREAPAVKVPRAKKLALRAPKQEIAERSARLRETRVDYSNIEPVRLQKALAASGVGSRREMEEWIEAGFITVNGKKAELGDKVGPQDRVTAKGNPIKLKWADRLPRVIMYHKQEGEIVSRDDPGGRVTVFDRLPQAKSSRWVAIGRLDVNTSGLLLVTTSGELANRMMHPSFEFDREYAVRVLGELTREQMKEMTSGIELEDGTAHFQRISEQGGAEEGANRWYKVVIREGRNREVRRMFEHFGISVSRLIRVRFGNIGLPPRLKRGQYYELNEAEVAAVMKWAGLTSTGQIKVRGGDAAK
ncbi:pseudouridine synthase [Vogesella fluminis]